MGRAGPPWIEAAAKSRASLYSCLAENPPTPGLGLGSLGSTRSPPQLCVFCQARGSSAAGPAQPSAFRDPRPWSAARQGLRGRGRGSCLLSQIRSLTAPSPVVYSLCTVKTELAAN